MSLAPRTPRIAARVAALAVGVLMPLAALALPAAAQTPRATVGHTAPAGQGWEHSHGQGWEHISTAAGQGWE